MRPCILHFGDNLPSFGQILLFFRQLPAESNDKLVLFSIDLHEARNGRGQALSEVLIPPREDRRIILAMVKE
jgi:hypothetical protein